MPPKTAQNKAKFSEGEKVLCYHGPLLYEAKCLQVEQRDGQMKYFVHYQGWNKNWDEWVNDTRIMKFNAVGLQKQKELKEYHAKANRKGKAAARKSEVKGQEATAAADKSGKEADVKESAAAAPAAAAPAAAAPKRVGRPPSSSQPTDKATAAAAATAAKREHSASIASDAGSASEASAPASASTVVAGHQVTAAAAAAAAASNNKRLRVQIEIPRLLKMCLADDRDYIVLQKRLVTLPPAQNHSVAAILSRFIGQSAESERETVSEFASGVQCYFNATLGTQLLYSFERPQLAALLRSHRAAQPAALYGCSHLLRLLCRMGDLLQHTRPDVRVLTLLLEYCDALLLFIEKHADLYLTPNQYEIAPSDYQRLAAHAATTAAG